MEDKKLNLVKIKEAAARLAISKSGLYQDKAYYRAFGLQITENNRVVESSIDVCIKNMAKANS